MKLFSRLLLFAPAFVFGIALPSPAQTESASEPAVTAEATLRRLDEPAPAEKSAAAAAPSAPAEPAAPDVPVVPAEPDVAPAPEGGAAVTPADAAERPTAGAEKKRERRSHREHRSERSGDGEQVSFLSNTYVAPGQVVRGAAVSILGNVAVDGEVEDEVVAILGNVRIDGDVHDDVVTVLGNVTLGARAHVGGDVVSVGGVVERDPRAVVEGKVVQQTIGGRWFIGAPVAAWWWHDLSQGRMPAWGPRLGWLSIGAVVALVLYALLALVFPRGLRRSGDLLAQRPGFVVLAAFLGVLALPVLFVLLLLTIIGIPVALLALPIGVMLAVFFGKAAIYTLVGRRLTGDRLPLAVATIVGCLLFSLLYLVPFVGLALTFLVGLLGFGCALLALFSSEKKVPTAAVPTPAPATTPAVLLLPADTAAAAMPPEPPSMGAQPEAAAAMPPPISSPTPSPTSSPVPAITWPRAGFWIRTAALLIDLILLGIISGMLRSGTFLVPLLAAYGAVMWKLKGTTIGGIVCGLKVVRLDQRPVDWPTAIVRALGCFLSLVIACLGFIWVAFDDEKQSWHDKIAGTTVVRVPKGMSLV